ncbi:Inositol-tetrakisphosphate 1-kinase [Arachis hypogaea]|nr:Inositol-tetrakisphosphate 1-kinase [Arachis hypogaea]
MRLNGEISHREGEGEGEEEAENEVGSSQKVVVGYALTSKKKRSFLQPKFLSFARYPLFLNIVALPSAATVPRSSSRASYALFNFIISREMGFHQVYGLAHENIPPWIFFVAIDLNKPLLEQGPFDVVLHKLSGKEWREVIEEYSEKHPEVTILDPPDAIQHLQTGNPCYKMQGWSSPAIVCNKNPSTIPYEITKAGMKLPLVAKPLVVDGTAKSHELFLAYDEFSLSELEPPLVLQEFVNHGGLLFKIYIVGETIKVVRRFSLPNISEHELSKVDGLFRFPRVSCAAASADEADLDPTIAEHPPRSLLERLAGELRRRLGLHLFNIDMIREYGTKNVFYVIDINYFPGYGKMPDYEHVFTDFLLSLVRTSLRRT